MLDQFPVWVSLVRYLCSLLGAVSAFVFLIVSPGVSAEPFSMTPFEEDDESPWEITAQTLTFEKEAGFYTAKGDVVIKKGSQALYAEHAVYNERSGIAEVWDDVRLEAGQDVMTGDRGVFDLTAKTGRIENGTLFLSENHFYLSGEVLEKLSEDSYLVRNCSLTTCDGDNPAWMITGSEVKVTLEGYGTVKDASFHVREWPVMYLPYAFFPAKTKRQTGFLLPWAGHSGRNGTQIELPFFWAISDQFDATFYQRYMSRRGYMQGVEFRYLLEESTRGNLVFDVLSDRREKDMEDPDDVEVSPFDRTNSTRYWLRGRTEQDLPYGTAARVDLDFVSDQDYLREFDEGQFAFRDQENLEKEFGRPFWEKRSELRRSAVRLQRDGDDYSLHAAAEYYQRPDDPDPDRTSQPLAGVSFVSLPRKFFAGPMYFDLDSDYNYIRQEEGRDGHRMSLAPEARFPMWLGPYVEFEPSFRYIVNAEWFDEELDNRNNQVFTAYETSLRLSTNLERIYDLNVAGAKKVKHRIWPTIRYTYRAFQDEEEDSAWFEPVESEGSANEIVFSLENYLDARLEDSQGNISYRQWGILILEQGYDIDEARRDEDELGGKEREPLTPLTAALILNPFPNLDLRGAARYDHYDNEIVSSSVSLDLTVPRGAGRIDRYEIDYLKESEEKSINLWCEIHLVRGYFVGGHLVRDIDLDRNIASGFWVGYKAQCWGLKIIAEREDQETSIMLAVQLFGLGDFGRW